MTCIGWLAVAAGLVWSLSARADLLSSSAFMIGSEGISRAGRLARAPRELEEVRMPIVGGLDIHRKQLTFDYLDTVTGEVKRGQITPADRQHLRAWLARFAGRDDVAFAMEGCTGWRYVAEELAAAGVAAHVAEPADTAAARGRKRRAKTDRLPASADAAGRGAAAGVLGAAAAGPGVPGAAGDLS